MIKLDVSVCNAAFVCSSLSWLAMYDLISIFLNAECKMQNSKLQKKYYFFLGSVVKIFCVSIWLFFFFFTIKKTSEFFVILRYTIYWFILLLLIRLDIAHIVFWCLQVFRSLGKVLDLIRYPLLCFQKSYCLSRSFYRLHVFQSRYSLLSS